MKFALTTLTLLVALLHLYFMVLEMFWWTKPAGRKAFGLTAEQAQTTKVLAANQGLYNGFLAAGLLWSLVLEPGAGWKVQVFFLTCVFVAGCYGAYSVHKRIFFIQGLPAGLALCLTALV